MYEEELIKNRKAIESSLKIDNNLKDIIDRFAEKQNLKGARFQGEVLLSLVGQTLQDHLGKAVHDLLRQASRNLSNQNYEEAKKSLDNAFDLNPNTAEVCFYMGYTLYDFGDFGDFDAAIMFTDKARELNSSCARNCHELKGLSLIKLKNYEYAILEFYETLKFDSAHYFTLGLCFSYLERYAEAIKYIEKTNGHFEFRGMLYQHLGNYSKSHECFDIALNSELTSPKIHYGKGVSLEYLATNCTGDERLQHYSQALNCFKKDIELNGANILALTHQAHILKILDREEAALESLNEAYKISQSSDIGSFNFSPKSLAFVKIMFVVREQMLARSQDTNTKLPDDEAGHSEPGMKSTPERELEKDPATLTAQITAQMPTYEITESNNLQSHLDLSLISAENTGESGEKVPSAQTIIEEEDKMSKASIEGKQNYNLVTSIVDPSVVFDLDNIEEFIERVEGYGDENSKYFEFFNIAAHCFKKICAELKKDNISEEVIDKVIDTYYIKSSLFKKTISQIQIEGENQNIDSAVEGAIKVIKEYQQKYDDGTLNEYIASIAPIEPEMPKPAEKKWFFAKYLELVSEEVCKKFNDFSVLYRRTLDEINKPDADRNSIRCKLKTQAKEIVEYSIAKNIDNQKFATCVKKLINSGALEYVWVADASISVVHTTENES